MLVSQSLPAPFPLSVYVPSTQNYLITHLLFLPWFIPIHPVSLPAPPTDTFTSLGTPLYVCSATPTQTFPWLACPWLIQTTPTSQLSPLAINPLYKPFSHSPLCQIVLFLLDTFALYPPAVWGHFDCFPELLA